MQKVCIGKKGDGIRSLLDKFSLKENSENKRCSRNIIFSISLGIIICHTGKNVNEKENCVHEHFLETISLNRK